MIINISEAANLAIHALTYLVNHAHQEPISTGQVANALNASEAHLSKVFQRLTKSGLVTSIRGPRGGFRLAQEPNTISLLRIYEAIDGPLSEGHCLLNNPTCDRSSCVFGDLLTNVRKQVDNHFSKTTLADLVDKQAS